MRARLGSTSERSSISSDTSFLIILIMLASSLMKFQLGGVETEKVLRQSAPIVTGVWPVASTSLVKWKHVLCIQTIFSLDTMEAKANSTKIGKGVTISMLLTDLCRSGLLKTKTWAKVTVPRKYNEPQSARNTLELCDRVALDNEKEALNNKNLADDQLMSHVSNIQTRAFHKMWEYEGKTVDVELQVRRKTNKSQTQEPTYMALGKRVRLHKQALAKSAGNSDYNREKLRPLPKEMPPGTPEDTKSLRGLFGGAVASDEEL